MIRACCVCRREIKGQGAQCFALGAELPAHVYNEASHGFCLVCFEDLHGPLEGPKPTTKKEESAGV